MHSVLFAFLDELLFVFSTDFFCCKEIEVTSFDRSTWTIHFVGRGQTFDRATHQQGTEVKAITYSAMQVHEGAAVRQPSQAEGDDGSDESVGVGKRRKGASCEIFVIVDI